MFDRLKKIYQKIKDLNKSINNYTNDSIIQSLPSVAYVNKAKKLIESKKYKEAFDVLNSALAISEKDPLIYKYLGKISEFQYKFKEASEYYKNTSALDPNDKEIWLRLGMCYLYSEQLEKALEAFEIADKVTPLNTDVYTGWGMAFMKQKKYSLAKDKFNMASKISKYNFTAILLSAVMEIRLQEYSSAEEKLDFLVKVAPNEGSLYEYSHLKLIQNKFEDAKIYAQKVLDLNKLMLPAYFILGEIYSIQKNEPKTNDTFKNAEDLGLKNSSLYIEWGKSLVRLLDFTNAKEKFSKALDTDKNSIEAKIGLALLNSYEGNYDLLEELKEKNPSNVYIQEASGVQMLARQEYNNAIEIFKKVIKTDPHQSYPNYLLAQAYRNLNDTYKVREYFDKFVNENPQSINALIEYSKWLTDISDFDEAQRKLKKAQRLQPRNTEVLNLLFFTCYTLVKNNISEYNIKEAISIAQQAMELGNFNYLPQKQELEEILKNNFS